MQKKKIAGLDLESAMKALLKFRNDRDWEQFHTPKNLSISVAIEAAELMEHFQWRSDAEIRQYLESPDGSLKVHEEIADIAAYLLLLSHDLGLDLNRCIEEKIKKNESKYPIGKSKGRHEKYDRI